MGKKKMEGIKITMHEGETVVCPYCKQSRLLTHDVIVNLGTDNVECVGALECGCPDAKIYQNKKKSKDSVPALLDKFNQFCEEEGITEIEPSLQHIKNACFAIIDGDVGKVTMYIKSATVKMVLNKDNRLEMKIESKHSVSGTT